MKTKLTNFCFENVLTVDNLITFFYMELDKNFHYEGEKHNFWEMVYLDKGKMICTADDKKFTLKSGELIFHKPNEFHNLESNKISSPNVGIITFNCINPAIDYFDGKIFKLDQNEKNILSQLFKEGLSCYEMENPDNPLIQKMHVKYDAPFGSSQATKNLLELILIRLIRKNLYTEKHKRESAVINGIDVSYPVKDILEYLNDNLCNKLTLKDIANHIHQSESTAKNIFSEYYRGGIIHYYNLLKIKEAKRLIREENMNMCQIAEYLHFENQQYFTNCFLRSSKMTPSEYKKSIMK